MVNPHYRLFDPEVLADPFALYKTIRENTPIYFDDNAGFWVVTQYQYVADLLRHPDIGSDRIFMADQQLAGLPEESIRDYKEGMINSMLMMDPPQHTTMRKIANQGFTHKAIEQWTKPIEEIFNGLLDSVCQKADFDFVSDIAGRFPTEVICELFAIPETDRQAFKKRAENIADFFGQTLSQGRKEIALKANESSRLNQQFLNELIEKRIKNPGDDMISLLIRTFASKPVNREQLISLCLLIITAGHITTIDLLSNGVFNLLKHPRQWALLKQHPELVDNTVEEVLRYDTSVPFTFRVAKKDLNFHGFTLPKGCLIALGIAAANHDPKLCRNPDVFDIKREKLRHLAFAVGPHTCLGAPLARMEMRIAFKILINRAPQLAFVKGRTPIIKSDTIMFKGFKTLPLKIS